MSSICGQFNVLEFHKLGNQIELNEEEMMKNKQCAFVFNLSFYLNKNNRIPIIKIFLALNYRNSTKKATNCISLATKPRYLHFQPTTTTHQNPFLQKYKHFLTRLT